jgi:GR25 family glycosyltransferase involved in LPS biosynthesis
MIDKYIIILAVFILLILFAINKQESFDGKTEDYINNNVKIFIINLLDRPQKKEYMINQMNKYNLQYNIFNAINGSQLNINSLSDSNIIDHTKSFKYMNRPMRRGEIGCALSHIFIWNSLLQDTSNIKYYLIFEDDAILVDNFKAKLEVIMKDIENKEWDVLYLNENCYKHFNNECDGDDFSDTTIKPSRAGYGLYGYVINKKFVEKCVNNLQKDAIPSLFPIYMPIDDYLDYKSKVNTFTCIRSKEIIVEVNRLFDSDTTKIK